MDAPFDWFGRLTNRAGGLSSIKIIFYLRCGGGKWMDNQWMGFAGVALLVMMMAIVLALLVQVR